MPNLLAQSGGWLGAHTANMLGAWQWALLALIPPAIILLYFLKLRRHPVVVPSTYLWMRSIEDLHVNSIWQRLRRNLLLFLQLLLLLLVILALLRPSFAGRKLLGKRSIFLVDNSASMQATDAEPSRLEDAKRHVRELIDEMRSGDVAMLVSFSDTAKVEQPYTDDRRRLRQALDAIQPSERRTSLVEALQVAAGLANPGRIATAAGDVPVADALPADMYIFSDGHFPPVTGFSLGNLKPVFVPIGGDATANLAITAFGVGRSERDARQLQAFAEIQNLGPEPASSMVELYLDDRLIDADRVEIAPAAGHGVAFDLGDISEGILRLKVVRTDALALDNESWAVLGAARQAEVLLLTPGNRPLELALQTDRAAELCKLRVESPDFLKQQEYRDLAGSGKFDLIVYDRCRPERMPAANTLSIAEVPPLAGWSAKPQTARPQIIDLDQIHPLLQWLDLSDVAIYVGTPLAIPPTAHMLIDSDSGPLLAIAPREAYEDAVLGFPLIQANDAGSQLLTTNWTSRLSFPTFVLNAIQYLGGVDHRNAQESFQPGAAVALTAPSAKSAVKVRTPVGAELPVAVDANGRAIFTNTDRQGVYRVTADGQPLRQFAVNLLDREESDLALGKDPSLQIGFTSVASQAGWEPARKELWKWLLIFGLGVLGIEWYIYNRRVHV